MIRPDTVAPTPSPERFKINGCDVDDWSPLDNATQRLDEAHALAPILECAIEFGGQEFDLLNPNIKCAAIRGIRHLVGQAAKSVHDAIG